jgi:hypothetical protein
VGVVAFGYQRDDGAEVAVIYSLGVVRNRRREKIGTLLKAAVLVVVESERPGTPVTSQVHRRNGAMIELNRSIGVSTTPDPEDLDYLLSVAPPVVLH